MECRMAALLDLTEISKSFPGVQALKRVSFAIHPGEVHVILGQNGAGKSSLIKVLSGAYLADGGQFALNGAPVAIRGPADARALGIAVIYQEFSLAPHLTLAQNIYLGRERQFARAGLVNPGAMRAAARRILDDLGLDLDVDSHAADLGVAHQQMVEIAKALSQDARILVMDEPTAAISDREADRLYEVIARLKARGVAIIFISHRMKEIAALGDRITIMRDGAVVGSFRRGEIAPDDMVRLMIGRPVEGLSRPQGRTPGAPVLRVEGLAVGRIAGIDLEVRAGEVVGLAGLVGSGRSEVVRAIFGADAPEQGRIVLHDTPRKLRPDLAARAGMALLPEDRKREGLALALPIRDNLTAASLWRHFRSGLYRPGRAEAIARDMIGRLGIATTGSGKRVRQLSGGNQQKVVLGKWLAAGAGLFLLDEPTRGVDVGAKFEIYQQIERLVADGAGVLVISSELPELVHLCDRAYVMRDGRIVGHLAGEALTEKAIIDLAVHQ
jgi:ribose transport system ATP-binding protein